MFKLRRLSDQPILEPIPNHPWESAAVFNCGVAIQDQRMVMIYRAADRDFSTIGDEKPDALRKFTSSLGYAVSDDGFTSHAKPIPSSKGKGNKKPGVWKTSPQQNR